jgi:predicted DNA-binding protein
MGISNETSNKIDSEISRFAVTGVFYLRDILELVVNGFNDVTLAEQEFVLEFHQGILHIFTDGCDQF